MMHCHGSGQGCSKGGVGMGQEVRNVFPLKLEKELEEAEAREVYTLKGGVH